MHSTVLIEGLCGPDVGPAPACGWFSTPALDSDADHDDDDWQGFGEDQEFFAREHVPSLIGQPGSVASA